MRDISTAPATGSDRGTSVRRRAGRRHGPERSAPRSDAHPLLAAHGGELTVQYLGTVAYEPAWELQDELARQRRERRIGDRLLLLEHFPVYTIGRGGNQANLLASPARLRQLGAAFHRIDRGGDVTFHGPGQIVAYPIVELRDPLDLRRYVRALEAAVIATLDAFGVAAERIDGLPGVWVEGRRKIAAIGVRVRRAVTTHGLALNVATDLRWYAEMIPCGIPDREVTSLVRELGKPVATDDVADRLAAELAKALGLRLEGGLPGIVGPAGGREQ